MQRCLKKTSLHSAVKTALSSVMDAKRSSILLVFENEEGTRCEQCDRRLCGGCRREKGLRHWECFSCEKELCDSTDCRSEPFCECLGCEKRMCTPCQKRTGPSPYVMGVLCDLCKEQVAAWEEHSNKSDLRCKRCRSDSDGKSRHEESLATNKMSRNRRKRKQRRRRVLERTGRRDLISTVFFNFCTHNKKLTLQKTCRSLSYKHIAVTNMDMSPPA
jgi:hypothetical protein